MPRETAGYRLVAVLGGTWKVCGRCRGRTPARLQVCRHCGRRLVKPGRKRKPARGTAERMALKLKQARERADLWARRTVAAADLLGWWRKKAADLARRVAAGPQAPRVRKPKPARRVVRVVAERSLPGDTGERP